MLISRPAWYLTSVFEVFFSGSSGRSARIDSFRPFQSEWPAARSSCSARVCTQRLR